MVDAFKDAAERVLKLNEKPSNKNLLKLYALFKQGSEGDIQGKRPGMLDVKGRAKFDAWKEVEGMSQSEAQEKYVALVDELESAQ